MNSKKKHDVVRQQEKRKALQQHDRKRGMIESARFNEKTTRHVSINAIDTSFPSGWTWGRPGGNAKARRFLITFDQAINVHKFKKRLEDTQALENIEGLL